jgi:hypothetical protein
MGLAAILRRPPPSTSGLGRHPFKVVARVRIPLGASGRLAQLGERLLYTQEVAGSRPAPPTQGRPLIKQVAQSHKVGSDPVRRRDSGQRRRPAAQNQPINAPSSKPASGANGTSVVTLTRMPRARPTTAATTAIHVRLRSVAALAIARTYFRPAGTIQSAASADPQHFASYD